MNSQKKPTGKGNREGRLVNFFTLVFVGFIAVLLTLTCSTGGYWIAPSSTATNPPELSFLLDTPILSFSTPEAEPEHTPFQDIEETPVSPNIPTATLPPVNTTPILYYVQAADTLPVVAVRFGVLPEEISSPDPIPETDLLTPNQLLIIPRRLANTTSSQHLLPDSEVVYSPSAIDFDVTAFVNQAGGYLSTYKDWFPSTKTTTGAEIVKRVALENSINPRLLLSLLEYQSHWVYGEPTNLAETDYPMGLVNLNRKGLYRQLVWAVNQLSIGYYSWREGRLTELTFADSGAQGFTARLAPDLNAGTVALQYFLARLYDGPRWVETLHLQEGLPGLHERMFGNPWERAQAVEPLYPPGLVQPPLSLPFQVDRLWSYTGGPHGAWEQDGSYAALDFAPGSSESGCVKSNAWVTASASGLVVRSGRGVVVLDLDGDGHEQTGWVLIYLHLSSEGRAPVGTWADADDALGHPSCEGGISTGTHVHYARKYNGEWIAADGPIPFVLSGWQAHAGPQAYKGSLTRDDQTIPANIYGSFTSRITRSENDP